MRNFLFILAVTMTSSVTDLAHAQAGSGDANVTTPSSPQPGTALPHADEKMPTAATGSNAELRDGYSSQTAARAACAPDTIVWADRTTRRFVDPEARSFGRTVHGFYTCRQRAGAEGLTPGDVR